MHLHKDVYQRTTAGTDLLLGVYAVIGVILTAQHTLQLRTVIWLVAFSSLIISSFVGAFAHGLAISEVAKERVWHLIRFSVIALLTAFALGICYEVFGEDATRSFAPWLMVVSLGVFLMSEKYTSTFYLLSGYQAVLMLGATIGALYRYSQTMNTAYAYMAGGIIVMIVGAILQLNKSLYWDFYWKFDHNGVFHLVQLVGLVFFGYGLYHLL